MSNIITKIINIVVFCALAMPMPMLAQTADYQLKEDVPYYGENVRRSDAYIAERCVLDIYYPAKVKNFKTIVWFHGGGLTGGRKELPKDLQNKGICVVGVNYRLHPKVSCPKYIEDAAAAVAWVFNNIADYGGSPDKIYVAGHSAGAYLTLITGLDKRWLAAHNIDANRIAALIPCSGNAITHFTVRLERGIPNTRAIVDDFAPVYHARPDAPPILLMTGDRELEMLGRYEENAYLARMLKINGHKHTILYEFEGYGHNMMHPAYPLLLKFVEDN